LLLLLTSPQHEVRCDAYAGGAQRRLQARTHSTWLPCKLQARSLALPAAAQHCCWCDWLVVNPQDCSHEGIQPCCLLVTAAAAAHKQGRQPACQCCCHATAAVLLLPLLLLQPWVQQEQASCHQQQLAVPRWQGGCHELLLLLLSIFTQQAGGQLLQQLLQCSWQCRCMVSAAVAPGCCCCCNGLQQLQTHISRQAWLCHYMAAAARAACCVLLYCFAWWGAPCCRRGPRLLLLLLAAVARQLPLHRCHCLVNVRHARPHNSSTWYSLCICNDGRLQQPGKQQRHVWTELPADNRCCRCCCVSKEGTQQGWMLQHSGSDRHMNAHRGAGWC
jgi:hypothetical protein